MVTGSSGFWSIASTLVRVRAIITRDTRAQTGDVERADAFAPCPVASARWRSWSTADLGAARPSQNRSCFCQRRTLLGPALRTARPHGKLEFVRKGLSISTSWSTAWEICPSSSKRPARVGEEKKWRLRSPSGCRRSACGGQSGVTPSSTGYGRPTDVSITSVARP
jgi:hypothetical protein